MSRFLKRFLFGMLQLNADCSDEIPPDYEMSVGGQPTNPISGASEITVNESSVVLDPTGRAIGLQQLQPDAEMALEAGESHIFASSKYRHITLTSLCDSGGKLFTDELSLEQLQST